MSGPPSKQQILDEDDRRVQNRRAQRRSDAISQLSTGELVALAGAPFWTPNTMSAAGFDFAAVAETARPLIRREDFGDDQTVSLELESLDAVLPHVREAAVTTLVDLGSRVANVAATAPPVLARWADVAMSLKAGTDEAAAQLLSEVRARCDAGQVGEAVDLIEGAAAVARVVGGALSVAERVARHRVEREFRDASDKRNLSFFVGRDEALAAFDELLAPEGPWALHYVGVGGAGKTTFIRHIAVEQAREHGLSVARVDFDYLSPAYPGRDPGQLVQAIVHELVDEIERSEQDRWLQSIHEQLERLRNVARVVHDDDPLGPIDWPEFKELLSFVRSFLDSFERPLIILDTCEELMKLSPVSGRIPSVEATFRLIEELHEVSKLRVIFAGRRLLATGGAGWRASTEGRRQALSAERPYLALCELRGMPRDKAEKVLERLLPETRLGEPALVEAILDRSPEDDRVTGLENAAEDGAQRFSPFRLVRFARWVVAEPTITAEALGEGDDPYIEQRIVQRMGTLEELLPYIAQLRRFDTETLAAVRGLTMPEARARMEQLSGHEWIETHNLERGTVLEAKATIREPLETYLRKHRGPAWHDAKEAIGAALRSRVSQPNATELPAEVIDAALRTMPETVAVSAWFELERNIGHDWNGALNLCRFLLGDGNAGAPRTMLGAAVRATFASATIHREPDTDVSDHWHEISEICEGLEAIETVRMLQCRAQLGTAAASGWKGGDPDHIRIWISAAVEAMGDRAPMVASCWIVAAIEGLIEAAERQATGNQLDRFAKGEVWNLAVPSGVGAYLLILRARAAALSDNDKLMRALVETVLAASEPNGFEMPTTCVDWLPPSTMEIRVAVETIRLLFYTDKVEALADLWAKALPKIAPERLDDDHDRLAAALIEVRGARKPRTTAWVPAVERRSRGLREPAVYRRFPTAAVAAEVWTRADRGGFEHDLSEVERVRIDLGRARRRRDGGLLGPLAAQSSDARLFVEFEQARAVVLEKSDGLAAFARHPSSVIDHWSHQRAITQAELKDAVEAIRPHVRELVARTGGKDWVAGTRTELALAEAIELSRYTARPLAIQFETMEAKGPPTRPDFIEQVLRLQLRSAASDFVDRDSLPSPLREACDAVPVLVGRLAIEEAELLSLRLPDNAYNLYEFAEDILERAGDTYHARAAGLGQRVCNRMLGSHVSPLEGEVPEALAGLAQRIDDPAASFARIERGEARNPFARDRVSAWLRKRAAMFGGIGLAIVIIAVFVAIVYGTWLLAERIVLPFVREHIFTWLPDWWGITALTVSATLKVVYDILDFFDTNTAQLLTTPVALWRWSQFRAWFGIRSTRGGATISLEHAGSTTEWDVPAPRPGERPTVNSTTESETSDAALQAIRHRIRRFSPYLALVRADIARDLTPFSWEIPLVVDLPNLVIWRPVQQPRLARSSAKREAKIHSDVAELWTKHMHVGAPAMIRDFCHFVGRPRRAIGRIELETNNTGDVPRNVAGFDIVLQLTPQDRDQASVATRTELGLLRELAVNLIEQGARSVIVLPAIARESLEKVIGGLALHTSKDRERTLVDLGRAVREARQRIRSHGSSYGDQLAIADEISLFFFERAK